MRYSNYSITIGKNEYILVSDDGGKFGPIFEVGSNCTEFPSPGFLETDGRVFWKGELIAFVPELASETVIARVGDQMKDEALVGLDVINKMDAEAANRSKEAASMTLRERRELRYPSDEKFIGLLS